MENVDITGRVKNWIRFGLIIPLAVAVALGYGAFEQRYHDENITIANARVEGTMVAVRTLVSGKVSELVLKDGEAVRVGDVIARLEVSVTEEAIAQLENTVKLAKMNLEDLKLGQIVKVPVKTIRTIPAAPQIIEYAPRGRSSAEIASLEDRANRMDELFEMGAISRVQRDAAWAAYENALAESYTPAPDIIYNEPTFVEEIEYVDQWQPTPPEAIQNAENAIKQAELSLNVALQEAQETEVIAPVSGTIYYVTEIDGDVTAGNAVARIGDSNELWLSAEVTENVFNSVRLGSPVDYVIAGRNLSGTVIEKIAPVIPEEIDTAIDDTVDVTDNVDSVDDAVESEPAEPVAQNAVGTDDNADAPANDKYVLRFSLPADRDFECTPNTTTTVTVHVF